MPDEEAPLDPDEKAAPEPVSDDETPDVDEGAITVPPELLEEGSR